MKNIAILHALLAKKEVADVTGADISNFPRK